MSGDRLVATVYWVAITVFLVGVAVIAVAATADLEALRLPSEVTIIAAWPIAAVGALLDTVRHQRREDAVERRTPEHGPAGPDDGPRLRSTA